MKQVEIIKAIATAWVCPNGKMPTTPYEIHEVQRLVKFAEDVIFSLKLDVKESE